MTALDSSSAPGWNEYKLLVLDQLEGLRASVQGLERKVDAFRADDIATVKVEIALLKQKAGLWGATAGLIPGAIAALVWWISKQ